MRALTTSRPTEIVRVTGQRRRRGAPDDDGCVVEMGAVLAHNWIRFGVHVGWLKVGREARSRSGNGVSKADWVGHYAGIGDVDGLEGFKRVAGACLQAFLDMGITST
jgi:hypothetical protein